VAHGLTGHFDSRLVLTGLSASWGSYAIAAGANEGREWGARTAIKSLHAEDGQVLISVSDTGAGLPPQKAEQISDAFFIAKPYGSGMGLQISRSIVECPRSRLWTAANAPRGSRGAKFHFTLYAGAQVPQ
jgi:signal transduction histidine kinase